MSRKIISNSLWMMAEKIISMFGLLFIASYVAKYVGPSVFGDIAMSMSIFQLIQIVSQLGSDVLIFKRISKNPISGVGLINATLPIRAILYVLISLPVLGYSYTAYSQTTLFFIVAAFISCFLQALDIYSIYYNAILKSQINTLINLLGLSISLIVRWYIAFAAMNPLWLSVPMIITPLIPLLIRFIIFKNSTSSPEITIRNKIRYTKYLLNAGSSFVMSSISVAIYTRLSTLMLGALISSAAAGIYSVAATLATSWSFILSAIITSSLPGIFSEKSDEVAMKKTASLNRVTLTISLPVLAGIFLLGKYFINYFYGSDYQDAVVPFIILSFATAIAALGTISARFIAKYSGYTFLSKKMLFVTLVSFVLNFFFIHYYGLSGAAIATLLTELFSLTLFNYLFRDKLILKLHFYTIQLHPWRN